LKIGVLTEAHTFYPKTISIYVDMHAIVFVSVEPFGGHRSRYFLYIFLYFFVKENDTEYVQSLQLINFTRTRTSR
jgi:hypothetical protein